MPRASVASEGLVDSWGRRNRKHPDINCAHCGVTFKPKRADTAYCSKPCARTKNGGHNLKLQGWWVSSKGYIEGKVWTAQGQRYVKQHRFIMECAIGRRLREEEDVHHINEDKQDNRLENLQILSHGEHSRLHNIARARGESA